MELLETNYILNVVTVQSFVDDKDFDNPIKSKFQFSEAYQIDFRSSA